MAVDPVFFYIIVRNDMDSLNQIGPAAAQSSHATSMLHETMYDRRISCLENGTSMSDDPLIALFHEWKAQAGQFGTTIVLSGPMNHARGVVEMASRAGYLSGINGDPEYWRRDGSYVFCTPEDIGGWMIGRKSELEALLGRFPLLKAKE